MGCPTLDQAVTTTDFRTGHRPPRRGDRDRQTWPRTGDQASAGRTPQRTEDRCGHTTGQARTPTRPHWQARQFRSTATHTMGSGPPENTRHQRPTPFGPQPSNTHRCSLIRNGSLPGSRDLRDRRNSPHRRPSKRGPLTKQTASREKVSHTSNLRLASSALNSAPVNLVITGVTGPTSIAVSPEPPGSAAMHAGSALAIQRVHQHRRSGFCGNDWGVRSFGG